MFNRALLSRSTKLAAVSAVVLSSIGIVASAGVSGAAIRPTSVASPGLVNGDFESPAFGATTYKQVDASTVPGWSTTEADNKIEIWSGGYGGVVAKSGTQFAELNATGPGALYQDVTGTSNTILSWSLAHRARCAGADVMALTEGVPGGSVTTLGTYSDLNTSWGVHTGSVAIPAGQDTTRLSLVSISSKCSSASMGNFVDAVSINIAHVPGVVQSLVSSTPSPDVVHLSWAAPLSDGGSPITGYVVTSPTDPGFVRSIPAGATSTDISGLAAGSTHSYAVAATNAVGTGASSLGAVNLVSGVKSGCTLYFSGAVSSAWEDPANWSDTANGQGANRVPGAADTVCFATSPARTDVVLSSKTSVAGIHFGASGGVTPHLTIAWNGDLSVTADSAAEVAALTENGHLSLGASTLFGVDTLTGSASIISGPGSLIVNKGGVADLSGSWPTLTNGARLVNLGTLNLDAGETFYLWGGSNIVNIGVFNMASNTDICVADNSSEGFANDHGGDLRADGSSGDVHVYPHFANDGVVEDLAGTLHIHGARNDGGSDSGSWNTSAGAKLDLDSGRSLAGAHIGGVGVTTLRGNTQLTGANISGGLDVEGNLSLLGGSKASLGSLTLNGSISGADVDVDGNFATGAGSADELDGVKLTLNGASEFGKNSTLKLNAGSSILSNGTSTLDNGFVAYSGDGAGSFSSNGNLEVGGHDNINVPLTVSGAVDVGRGTLNALGGLTEKAGADIRVSESGGVSGSFNAGSHPTLSGTLTLSEDAGSIPVSGESFYPVLYSNGSGALSVRSNLANGSWKSSVDAQGLRVDVYGAPVWTSAGSVTFTTSTAGTFTTSFTGASGTTISLNGALPSGLNFNASTGVLGGTPAAGTGGTYPLSLTATNSLGSAVGSLTLTVKQPAAFTSAASSTFVVGVAGNFKVSASGFPAPTFSASGILPAGVSLDSTTGVLSGTPSATGVYPVTITATNGVGAAATQKFSLTVNSKPSITSPSSAAFTVGTLGTFTVVAQGVPNPTFSESGSLPSGVTLNASTGVLSGTPAAGTGKVYPITITASNSAGTSAQSFTLTVNQAPAITSAATATFKTGTAGSFTAVATGFPAPTFTESGALPAGVTLSSSGVLSGTPAAGTGGSWPTTITASNSTSSVSQSFNLVVNQAAAFTSSSTTSFVVGQAGSFTPTASGFPAPTFTESGTLPAGVTFANGVLSGTPAAGTGKTYAITLTAVSSSGNATQSFTLTVQQAPAITSAATATFKTGTAGSFTAVATGFPAATFTESGALPAGVTLSSSGVLSGTPAAGTGGSWPITITASNAAGNATQSFVLNVNQPAAFTSKASATFTVGQAGSFTPTASGFPTPTFTESGTLPAGVTFTNGVLSGTPAAGTGKTYAITLTASSAGGNASQSFTLTVNQAPAITSAATATFKTGTAGSFTAVATGFPAATFTESGALPAGVTLSSSGVLSGTPAAETGGSWPITITASNSTSSVSQSFNLVVNQAAEFTSSANATFKVGVAGKFTPTATGFPTPTFTESGTLPAGVTFANGVLSGTPAAGTARSYVITLTAVSGGGNATQAFTLTVKP